MKYLRLSLVAGILTMVLATSALAGEMPLPGVASPTPPSAAGEMPLPGIASTDAVTEIALGLVQSVLSLF
jgi:hypothetical protein